MRLEELSDLGSGRREKRVARRVDVAVRVGAVREEQFHQPQLAGAGCRVQRASFRRIRLFPVRIRAALEQQARNVVVAHLDGCRQRPPAARPRLADALGLRIEHLSHALEIAKRAGDGEIVGRAARQQQPCILDIASAAIRCPRSPCRSARDRSRHRDARAHRRRGRAAAR